MWTTSMMLDDDDTDVFVIAMSRFWNKSRTLDKNEIIVDRKFRISVMKIQVFTCWMVNTNTYSHTNLSIVPVIPFRLSSSPLYYVVTVLWLYFYVLHIYLVEVYNYTAIFEIIKLCLNDHMFRFKKCRIVNVIIHG